MKFTLVTRNTILERKEEVVNCLEQKSREKWGSEVAGEWKECTFPFPLHPPHPLLWYMNFLWDFFLTAISLCPSPVPSTGMQATKPLGPQLSHCQSLASSQLTSDTPLPQRLLQTVLSFSPISCLLPAPPTGRANCWCSDATPVPRLVITAQLFSWAF